MNRIENVEKQTSIAQRSDDKRNRWIDGHVLAVFMRFVGRSILGSECDGYCWIAKDSLEKVHEKLSPAKSINAIVNSSVADFDSGKIGFVDVRVLATFRIKKDDDDFDLDVSGTLTLPFVISEYAEGSLLDGYSPERDPITMKLTSRVRGLESANLNADLTAVFKDPPLTDTHFVRFPIGKQALNEVDKSLICESCGRLEEEGLSSVEFSNATFRLCRECCCQEFDIPECIPTEEERQRFCWHDGERHARPAEYEAADLIRSTRSSVSENKARQPQVSAPIPGAELAQTASSIDDPYFSVAELPGGRGDEARQKELLGIEEDADQNDSVVSQT